MSKLLTVLAIAGALLGAGAMVYGDAAAKGDDNHGKRGRDFMPVMNADYQNECGTCHMAYPPGLLPARSWEKLMDGLADHFGDNAELDPETSAAITRYLVEHAAEHDGSRRAAKFLRSIPTTDTPLRVTETRYFVKKHDEIPEHMVADNPEVKSFANCAACHRTAEKGIFDDDNARIPGYENARF